MAITQIGRPVSLTATGVSCSSINITSLQNYNCGDTTAVAEFTDGTLRVPKFYQGKKGYQIRVATSDYSKVYGLAVGNKYSSIVLTVEGAKDSAGSTTGSNVTYTMSKGVLTDIGEVSKDNQDSTPAVVQLTFTLANHQSDTSDATITIA